MQDLSDLARGSLVMNSSMGGGNTVSVNPPFSPEGSESEATQGIETHSQPEPDLGPNADSRLNTKHNDAGEFHVTPPIWKKVP
jgi:hypothetical protein